MTNRCIESPAIAQARERALGQARRDGQTGLPPEAVAACTNGTLASQLLQRPIILCARNSGSGKHADEQCAADAHDVNGRLVNELGIDVGPDFPTPKAIIKALRAAPVVEHRVGDGKTFKSRTAIFDHTDEGWMLIVSSGTGKTLDEYGHQPWVETLREAILRHEPHIVAATRLDRMLRYKWALGRILDPLEKTNSAVFDECGVTYVTEDTDIIFFIRASHAEAESTKLRRNSLNGVRRHTEEAMVDGVIAVAAPRNAPPGFVRRDLPGRGIGGRTSVVWALDSPGVLARHGLEAGGADQVELIRWALSQLGQPGVRVSSINEAIVTRGYTTSAFRDRHGPDATWRSVAATRRWGIGSGPMTSIVENLDLYRTGRLIVTLGGAEEPVELTNLFPADGRWASDEDWLRIDAWTNRDKPRECYRTNQFAGLAVTVNGKPAVLRSTPGQHQGHPVRGYRCVNKHEKVADRVHLPHALLADVVVDAIVDAGENAVQLADTGEDRVEDAALAAAHRNQLAAAAESEAKAAAILATVVQAGAIGDGTALDGPLLADLNSRYAQLIEQAAAADHEARRSNRELNDRRRQRATTAAVNTQSLLHLVEAVREPDDHPLRLTLIQSLRNVTITTEGRGNDRGELHVNVTADLVFEAGSETWTSRGHASYTKESETAALVAEQAAALRDGTGSGRYAGYIEALAQEMNTTVGGVRLLEAIDDQRLARLHAAAYLDATDSEIARKLSEPVELIRRARRIHAERDTRASFMWLRGNSSKIAAIYDEATKDPDRIARWEHLVPHASRKRTYVVESIRRFGYSDEWTAIAGVGLRLRRSCSCRAGATFTPVRLREAAGSICNVCGSDATGISWPTAFANRYAHRGDI